MVNALFTALALIAAGQVEPAAGERTSTKNARGEHSASLPTRRTAAGRAKAISRLDRRRQG